MQYYPYSYLLSNEKHSLVVTIAKTLIVLSSSFILPQVELCYYFENSPSGAREHYAHATTGKPLRPQSSTLLTNYKILPVYEPQTFFHTSISRAVVANSSCCCQLHHTHPCPFSDDRHSALLRYTSAPYSHHPCLLINIIFAKVAKLCLTK